MLFRRNGRQRWVWLTAIMLVSLCAGAVRKPQQRWDVKPQLDSLSLARNLMSDMERTRRMSSSLYPVQLQVHGRLVRIQSDHNQILPIYNHSGAFFMAMRLSKGTNWLNGLPRGRYFINNRPITIK